MGQRLPVGEVGVEDLRFRLELIERALKIGPPDSVHGQSPHQYFALTDFSGLVPQHSLDASRAAMVRKLLKSRRKRDMMFSDGLFADPAWDIMLDLYAAHYEGRSVSVSSLCIASAVPATTALRWIKTMTDDGLLERSEDKDDKRRVFIRLSDEARGKLDDFFDKESN